MPSSTPKATYINKNTPSILEHANWRGLGEPKCQAWKGHGVHCNIHPHDATVYGTNTDEHMNKANHHLQHQRDHPNVVGLYNAQDTRLTKGQIRIEGEVNQWGLPLLTKHQQRHSSKTHAINIYSIMSIMIMEFQESNYCIHNILETPTATLPEPHHPHIVWLQHASSSNKSNRSPPPSPRKGQNSHQDCTTLEIPPRAYILMFH